MLRLNSGSGQCRGRVAVNVPPSNPLFRSSPLDHRVFENIEGHRAIH